MNIQFQLDPSEMVEIRQRTYAEFNRIACEQARRVELGQEHEKRRQRALVEDDTLQDRIERAERSAGWDSRP